MLNYVELTKEDDAYLAKKAELNLESFASNVEKVIAWPKAKLESHLKNLTKEESFAFRREHGYFPNTVEDPNDSWLGYFTKQIFTSFTGDGASSWGGAFKPDMMKVPGHIKMLFAFSFLVTQIATPIPTDTILLRGIYDHGIDDRESLIHRLNICLKYDQPFRSKNFFSCTYLEDYVKNKYLRQGGYQLVISIPSGTPVLKIIIGNYSGGEGEFILPFNMTFKVISIDHESRNIFMILLKEENQPQHHFYSNYDEKNQISAFASDIRGSQTNQWPDEATKLDYLVRYKGTCGMDCT